MIKGFPTFTWASAKYPASVNRKIITTDYLKTDEETFFGWLREILSDQQIEQFKENLEYDGATQYEGVVRVRINIFVSQRPRWCLADSVENSLNGTAAASVSGAVSLP